MYNKYIANSLYIYIEKDVTNLSVHRQ